MSQTIRLLIADDHPVVRDGLAAASTDRVRAGKREMQVTRVRITDAGREALAGGRK